MTISYELAKELKEAGFPQKFESHHIRCGTCNCSPCGKHWKSEPDPDHYYSIPTLSELIDACRVPYIAKPEVKVMAPSTNTSSVAVECEVPFDTLMCLDNEWHAGRSFVEGFDYGSTHGSGSTPSEAVARLWLALNHKNTK